MDLSIIIVEYRNTALLKEAIASVQNNFTDLRSEIFVISNSGYSGEKQKQLCSKFSKVKFIFNHDNVGFSKGVNQGIFHSSGEFLLLLNPDAKILDESIIDAVDFMKRNPQIGVVGPKILDRIGQVQDSCRNFMTLRRLIVRNLRRLFKLNSGGILEIKNYSQCQPVDWISGACMLVKRRAINKVGPMDERFFMYIEDMDWCRRFWQRGWEVWYLPDWQVEHNSERSSSADLIIKSKLPWIHLISFWKYYFKWFRLSISL